MNVAVEVSRPLDVFSAIVGQDRVVAQLRAAVAAPVHAYLFVGPPGTGKRHAAQCFAAALLCEQGGCGVCSVCRRVLDGSHLDVVSVERAGAAITVEQAHEITRVSARSPAEGRRKVIIAVDIHLAERSAPALLKTIEEPPASTVFVLLAEQVPAELVTIASRCVRLDFGPLAPGVIREVLVGEGVDPMTADDASRSAGGRLDRARLLAGDPGVRARRAAWEGVPARLDGTGATTAIIAAELVGLLSSAGAEALAARQAAELAASEERAAATGERITGRKELDERHRRENRRLRTDELRMGLAWLAGAYRDRAVGGPGSARHAIAAAGMVQDVAEVLIRFPNETLLLQSLLVRLDADA